MVIPLAPAAFAKALEEWKKGSTIQKAFPTLDSIAREFLKTGITESEWKKIFG